MSAIGNYVHYNASRYMKYGTSRQSATGKQVSIGYWNTIKAKFLNDLKSNFNKNELKNIEDQYNTFRNDIRLDKKYAKVRQKIIDLLADNSKDRTKLINNKGIVYNWDRMVVYDLNNSAVKQNQENLNKMKSKIKATSEKSENAYLKPLVKRFQQAYLELNGIQEIESKKTLKAQLDNLLLQLGALLQNGDSILKELGLGTANLSNFKGRKITKTEAKNIENQLLSIMGLIDVGYLPNAIGEFEEYLAAATSLKAQGLAASQIVKHLEAEINKHGGGAKTKTTISSNLISVSDSVAKALQQEKDYTFMDKEGNKYSYYVSSTPTSQKMDAYFIYEEGKDGIALNIKNYNLSHPRDIKLVGSSPLSHFLFNLGDENLTNHFLNIFASHKNEPISFKDVRKSAEIALTYRLLYSALSGKNVGKDGGFADVFVVNDNSKSGAKNAIRMYDIPTMIHTIAEQQEKLLKYVTIDPELSSIYLDNPWQNRGRHIGDNIQRRLTYLLASVRKYKISVMLNSNALKYM